MDLHIHCSIAYCFQTTRTARHIMWASEQNLGFLSVLYWFLCLEEVMEKDYPRSAILRQPFFLHGMVALFMK